MAILWSVSNAFSDLTLTPLDACRVRAPHGFDRLLNPDAGVVKVIEICERPLQVHEENGRYYHVFKRGTYPFPCDDVCLAFLVDSAWTTPSDLELQPERGRQDVCHHLIYKCILRHVDKQNALAAPLIAQDPNLILDLGCGSGAWCMDMAKYVLCQYLSGGLRLTNWQTLPECRGRRLSRHLLQVSAT